MRQWYTTTLIVVGAVAVVLLAAGPHAQLVPQALGQLSPSKAAAGSIAPVPAQAVHQQVLPTPQAISLSGGGLMPATPVAVRQPNDRPIGSTAGADQLETQLARIYIEISNGRINRGLELTDALLTQHPNFRLAHMVRGDLLAIKANRWVQRPGAPSGATEEQLMGLRQEALVRLRGYSERPPANAVPRYLMQLRPDQKTAVVVDTHRSRLYVYENVNGRPRFLADFYMTQGAMGADKAREGDKKTPLGVYLITSQIPKNKLPDFYGSGALPINYPNDWDKRNGRTGSGIWLHGVPSNTYSRPPLASDGCVVLANSDFEKVLGIVQPGLTPVVISDKIEWLSLDDWDSERRSLQAAFEEWRHDWESLNTAKYLSHYSRNFKSDDGDFAQWTERKRRVQAARQWQKIWTSNVSMLRYPGKDQVVEILYDQDYRSDGLNSQSRKRQYWQRESGKWRIVFEGGA